MAAGSLTEFESQLYLHQARGIGLILKCKIHVSRHHRQKLSNETNKEIQNRKQHHYISILLCLNSTSTTLTQVSSSLSFFLLLRNSHFHCFLFFFCLNHNEVSWFCFIFFCMLMFLLFIFSLNFESFLRKEVAQFGEVYVCL